MSKHSTKTQLIVIGRGGEGAGGKTLIAKAILDFYKGNDNVKKFKPAEKHSRKTSKQKKNKYENK